MGLLTAGYWPTTYWPSNYWPSNYWQKYGAVPPPVPVEGTGSYFVRREQWRGPGI